jgi:hypothetical protein
MPYEKREIEIIEIRRIIAEEKGKEVSRLIDWKFIKMTDVVVFCRKIPNKPDHLKLFVAADEKSFKKEKKEPADIVFTIDGMSGLIKSLAISGKHAKIPRRKILLSEIYA